MPTLYVLRHGQTEYNLQKRVQGRCDSPLTPLGVEQARAAGRWLAGQGVRFDRMCTSPLGPRGLNARGGASGATKGRREEPPADGAPSTASWSEAMAPLRAGRLPTVPTELWDPGETLVPYGGEGSAALRERVVAAMTEVIGAPGVERAARGVPRLRHAAVQARVGALGALPAGRAPRQLLRARF